MDEMTQRLSELPAIKLAFAAKQLRDKQRVIQAEPIAIIGLSCRFPGDAASPEGFWELLRQGRDTLERVPAERWDADALYDPRPGTPGKMHVRDGHFVRNVADFDPLFFGIAPKEARSMDPQQRLLLEVCHEALERACQAPDRLRGTKTGVFMGIMHLDFAAREAGAGGSVVNMANMSFNRLCIAAGRIAYALGLQGPAIALDTACSSSLVTVHQACQSLRQGDCDLALAGGVNLNLAPETMIVQSHKGMLSADGRCKSFAAGADGFGRGEGAGVVVLKRLSDAIADGDDVLALVRGSAVNHSGTSSGLTVPNGRALERLVRDALTVAGVRPDQVSYVEAQGTGTALGDSIEMQALGRAFAGARKEPLWVGSVKTNIGHLEAAAGIAALIKVVLALQNERIPQHLHFDEPNPTIAWDTLPVRIATHAVRWPAEDRRIAGVSAFGYSGTNAHVVVEGAPPLAHVRPAPLADERPARVLALSARTDAALREHAARFAEALAHTHASPASVAHSANAGRNAMAHRLAVVGRDVAAWRAQLHAIARGHVVAGALAGSVLGGPPPLVAFVFPSTWTVARERAIALARSEPVVRGVLERCRAELPDASRASELWFDGAQGTPLEHAALFAWQMALAGLWRSWGIEPEAVLGHGPGELAAACTAGIVSLEDGLRLAIAWGRQGDASASAHHERARIVAGVAFATSALRAISTAEAHGSDEPMTHAGHWLRHLERAPGAARTEQALAGGIRTLQSAGYQAFLSLGGDDPWLAHARAAIDGPHAPASADAPQASASADAPYAPAGAARTLHLWSSMPAGPNEPHGIAHTLAACFVAGLPVRWSNVDAAWANASLVLPTYPFQRRRYWPDDPRPARTHSPEHLDSPAHADHADDPTPATSALARRIQALPPEEGRPLVHASFVEQLRAVLGLEADDTFDHAASLSALGLDSLMSADLHRRITKHLGVTLPPELLMSPTSVLALSAETHRLLCLGALAQPAAPPAPDTPVHWAQRTFDQFMNRGARDLTEVEDLRSWRTAMQNDGLEAVFERPHLSSPGPSVAVLQADGSTSRCVSFTSYNYLGYANHPHVITGAKDALDTYGLGASSSPVLGGTLGVHGEFERALADYLGQPGYGVSLFSSGYNANLGAISALLNEHQYLVCDRKVHMSVLEGGKLSGAKIRFFAHNDPADLERVLAGIDARRHRVIVAMDGVYSVSGTFGRVAEIAEVTKRWGAYLLVDEAHSMLLTGPNGRGVAAAQGVLDKVDLLVMTMSKSFGGVGGAVYAKEELAHYINWFARCRMFSCALNPGVVGGLAKVPALAASLDGSLRRERLMRNANMLRALLRDHVSIGESESWVIPVYIGSYDKIAYLGDWLRRQGLEVGTVSYPAVAKDSSCLRLFVTSEHTDEQLEFASNVIIGGADEFDYRAERGAKSQE
ncbi:type I polyketide synthase [Pendulispora albinea]|uniref:Aminotransferase class I/II-fold pyridoxal phosphate-dependent enzyme n=1 Tax=Pendulispora albinea TaxID=2741071 RepID=A0ABZ2M6K1_9BACT